MAETPGDAPAGSVAASPGEVVQPPVGSVAASPGVVVRPPAGGGAEASDGVVTVFRNDGAPWWNPALRFAHGEGSGELLPLDQSTSFKLTARVKIPPLYSRGAVFAQAPVDRVGNGVWRNESRRGISGTVFGVRGGRPFYDIGWVGSVDCDVVVNDDAWHDVAVVFDGRQYHLEVDGAFVRVVRAPVLESGNARACRAGDDFRVLVGARVGPLLDAAEREAWHPRFDAETSAVAAGMGPELPLGFIASIAFEAPCASARTHCARLPPLLSRGDDARAEAPAASDEPLREAVLAYPEQSREVPLLVVPRGYLGAAPLEEFAESLLDAIRRLGPVERERPALLFEVGKPRKGASGVNDFRKGAWINSFRVEAPDDGEDDGTDAGAGAGAGAVSRSAAAAAQDGYEAILEAARAAAEESESGAAPPHSAETVAEYVAHKQVIKHSRLVLESRVASLLASVMTTCDEAGAWVKFDFPYACNALCSMVCADAPPTVLRLGLLMRNDEVWKARHDIHAEFTVFRDLYDRLEDRASSRVLGDAGSALPRVEVPMAAIERTCERQRVRNFAPHPSLSHAVFFQSNADRHRFNAALSSALQIPSGRFLVNGTDYALRSCLETIAACRPVFCFKHTGGASRPVAHLLETRLKADHNRPLPLPARCAACAARGGGAAPGAFCPHVTATTRVLSENWPENWNAASVLVVDPLTQTAEQLQDKITAVMSSVFEGAATELGGREAERVAISYAWRLHACLEKNAAMQRRLALCLHACVTGLTLLTVAAATVAASLARSPPGLDLATLLLPAATAAAIGIAGQLKAVPKWAACRLAAHKCEREVYRYRAQVGDYAPVLGRRAAAKGARNPRRAFTAALKEIWADLHASELKVGGLAALGDAEASAARGRLEARERSAAERDRRAAERAAKRSAKRSAKVRPAGAPVSAPVSAPEHKAPAFGKLSAEDYIKVRHTEVLARYERSVRRLRLGVGLVDALAILLTSGGTALVAVGLVRWVPVLMAFAAAVASIANHAALGPKLRGANEAIATLHQLHLWWQGLTLIQKRANANKTHLVDMTEACVSHELSAFVSASLAAAKPKKDGDGDDADVGAAGGAADAAPAAADGTARQRRRPPGGGDGR